MNKFGLPKDMVGALDYVAPEVFKVSNPEAAKMVKASQKTGTYDYKVDVWMVSDWMCVFHSCLIFVRVSYLCAGTTTKWMCGW